jgi:hypothetical protein
VIKIWNKLDRHKPMMVLDKKFMKNPQNNQGATLRVSTALKRLEVHPIP